MESTITETIKCTTLGWDNIVQSMIQFGLTLTDMTITKLEPASKKVVQLGQLILIQAFKLQQVARGEIMEQILSRVITRSESGLHYVRLLSSIVSESPQLILDYVQKVKVS